MEQKKSLVVKCPFDKNKGDCDLEMVPGLRKGTFSGRCWDSCFSFCCDNVEEALERARKYRGCYNK